jgi:hypothetical protein
MQELACEIVVIRWQAMMIIRDYLCVLSHSDHAGAPGCNGFVLAYS